MKTLTLCAISLLFTTLLAQPSGQNKPLTIGNPPPGFQPGRWIKGTPVTGFEKDHIYIIEFGSIACAPCRASIPHLTELARNYKETLTLISVYVLENGSHPPKDTSSTAYFTRVERFIEKMGDKIAYSVVVDNPRQSLYADWLKAAGLIGVPAAFIIGKDSTIAWIGHPMNLGEKINELLSAEPRQAINHTAGDEEQNTRLVNALDQKNYDAALAIADSLIRKNPSFLYQVQKFSILLALDEDRAWNYANYLLREELRDNEPALNYLAQEILYTDKQLHRQDWYDLAIIITRRALQVCRDEKIAASLMHLQAQASHRNGNPCAAARIQEEALSILKRNITEDYLLKSFEETFQTFKSQCQ